MKNAANIKLIVGSLILISFGYVYYAFFYVKPRTIVFDATTKLMSEPYPDGWGNLQSQTGSKVIAELYASEQAVVTDEWAEKDYMVYKVKTAQNVKGYIFSGDPFHNLEQSKDTIPNSAPPAINSAEQERLAREDFEAVLKGKLPIHAKLRDLMLADGGTTFYNGDGYSLEVRKRLADDGKEGFNYGPIIEFENIKEDAKPKKMSSLKFYSIEDMQKLLETNR